MAAKREHHYVPQFMLRLFTHWGDAKRIRVYVVERDQTIDGASIRSQAKRLNLHGCVQIEDMLGLIETKAAAEIHSIIKNPRCFGELTEDSKAYLPLLRFIMLQQSRDPTTGRGVANSMCESAKRMFLEDMQHDEPEMFARLEQLGLDSFVVTLDERTGTLESIATAIDSYPLFCDLAPVLIINRTDEHFVLGDRPCVLHNPALHDHREIRGVIGLTSRGLIVIFSISPTLTILLYDSQMYRVASSKNRLFAKATIGDIRELNRAQFLRSAEVIFPYRLDAEAIQAYGDERRQCGLYRRCTQKWFDTDDGPFTHHLQEDHDVPIRLSFLRQVRRPRPNDAAFPRSYQLRSLLSFDESTTPPSREEQERTAYATIVAFDDHRSCREGNARYDCEENVGTKGDFERIDVSNEQKIQF